MYTIGTVKNVDYYGVVEHTSKHMETNTDIVKSRRYAALMHEGLHAIENFYRLEIPHKTITAIATWQIAMLGYVPKLRGNTWRIETDCFPIKIRKDSKGMHAKRTLMEMFKTLSFFNKWPIFEQRIFDVLSNMIWTFDLNATTLNEETGEWA